MISQEIQHLSSQIKNAAASTIVVALKDLPPSIKKALASVGYKKHTITVKTVDQISPFDAGGDGRRAFFIAFDLETGRTLKESWGSWGGANMFNPKNQVDLDTEKYTIPEGVAVIKGSEGNYIYANLYIRPENITPLLSAPGDEISEEDFNVLQALTMKSNYKLDELGRSNRKFVTLDYRKNGYVLTKLGAEKIEELRKRGFIKPGVLGLTVEGKNALAQRRGY
jgi:hypothetical protein